MKIVTTSSVVVVDAPTRPQSWTIGDVPAKSCIALPPSTPNR
jgi:hypothetical protein